MKKNEWLRAVVFGTLTGLIGVALFIALLTNAMQEEKEKKVESNEKIAVQQQNEQQEILQKTFFASQHGLFSSEEGAAQWIAANPSLNKSAIIKVEEQFFIWSAMAVKKAPETLPTGAFYKQFSVKASCPNPALQRLPDVLYDEKYVKNNFDMKEEQGQLPEDWQELTTTLASLSKDPNVIRLHLFTHYYSKNDCLKIEF